MSGGEEEKRKALSEEEEVSSEGPQEEIDSDEIASLGSNEEESEEDEIEQDVAQFIHAEADDPSEDFETTGYETEKELEETVDGESFAKIADSASLLGKRTRSGRRTRKPFGDVAPPSKMFKGPDMQYAISDDDEEDYQLKTDGFVSQDVIKQSRMPSIKDSNLWILRCKAGEEFHAASLIMNKFVASNASGKNLGIDSIVYRHNLPGYIYVESSSQGAVKEAIEGISALRTNLYRDLVTVALKEMPSVMRIVRGSQMELKEDDFVRVRRGVYKDDLARIVYVDHSLNKLQLKLIPRSSSGMDIKNKQVRPPQKLFDKSSAIPNELYEDEDGFLIYQGQQYTNDGFLIKTFPMHAIITSGVEPSLAELRRFENEDSLNTKTLLKMKHRKFNVGDRVCVVSGDLENLEGKILSINEATVSVMPVHNDLNTAIDFAPTELVKLFDQGDHIKIIAGNHVNETGHILNIADGFATILSDMNMKELNVKIDDLQLSKEKSSGIDQTGQYQYGDLVLLDEQNVGMIIQIEKECFRILNCQGKLTPINRSEILRKRNKPNAITLDADHNPVGIKMQVKVINGPMSGQEGHVLSIFRHFIFIKSNSYPENGGILVTRAKNIKIFSNNLDYGVMNNYASNTLLRSPQRTIQSPNHQKTPARQNGQSGSGGRIITSKRHPLIGRSVRITKGPYKTYSGIVKATTDTTARIELTSQYKTINVDLSRIIPVDTAPEEITTTSASTYWNTPYGQSGAATLPAQTPRGSFMTPMYDGSKTPRVGSQTPRVGSQTPNHMTPHRNPSLADDGFSAPNSSLLNPSDSVASHYAPSSIMSEPSSFPVGNSTDTTSSILPQVSPALPISPSLTDSTYNYMSSVPSSSIETPTTPFVGNNYDLPNFLSNSLDWISVGLITVIKDSYNDSNFVGKKAEVRGINGSQISAFVKDLQRTITLNGIHLLPSMPERKDFVKVIHGEEKEKSGTIISIDESEAIVKFDGAIQLISMNLLCKCIQPSE